LSLLKLIFISGQVSFIAKYNDVCLFVFGHFLEGLHPIDEVGVGGGIWVSGELLLVS
jgi:hypothetical protein